MKRKKNSDQLKHVVTNLKNMALTIKKYNDEISSLETEIIDLIERANHLGRMREQQINALNKALAYLEQDIS